MKEDLGFGHMGNGITVWDRNQLESNDFKTVAHIGYEREISYYDENLTEEAITRIENFAKRENSCASFMQAYPVLKPIRFTEMKVEEIKELFSTKVKDDIEVAVMYNPNKVLVFSTEEVCNKLSRYYRYTKNEVKKGLYHWHFIMHE
ncbi:hypothetical protein [Dysgonomonas sp. ZJ709]|uniref:hypothetical protein n=1 Tax=Dysgonomonas sp. ZJ709 TaxID=2709797 RepID=UPI0016244E8D|nr:hypothetical protein [Dysgonomonas sp. ZJ709]